MQVSVEALLATRPTPSGVTFKQSDPRDWDDDHDPDEDPELKQLVQVGTLALLCQKRDHLHPCLACKHMMHSA